MEQDARLAALLARINADALREFACPSGQPLDQIVETTRRPSAASASAKLSADFHAQLMAAVLAIRDGRAPDSYRTLRFQCLGCATFLAEAKYALVADAKALARLFAYVENYRDDVFRLRRLLDALLRAYLGARRHEPWCGRPEALAGTTRIREFIASHFPAIDALEPRPDWVATLQSFPEVLSNDPGSRFARDWLTTGGDEFRDLSRRLGLTGDSWLASDTLLSALSSATKEHEAAFVGHITALLNAAAEPRFLPVRDTIYRGVLTRYVTMRAQPVHPGLRDALVSAWRNPWLARNDSAWAHVPDAARRLIAGWLKLDLIHQFFEVLSEDGKQDRSRFDFWRQYHQDMDDVYFALGSRAYSSRTPDLVKLRNALDGRLLELIGTESDNNAFIMCMGDTVVVEFSKKGNAAYRYSRGQLELDQRHSIGIGELRQDATQRLIHRDTRDGGWQDRFRGALRRQQGQTERRTPQIAGHTMPSEAKVLPRQPNPDISQDATCFARKAGIAIEDHRSNGGSLWLRVDDADSDINRQLTSWGFKHRPGRGWWRAA